jgi:regulator of ribonuclease activity A
MPIIQRIHFLNLGVGHRLVVCPQTELAWSLIMFVSTPDLCDEYGEAVSVLDPVFHHYGGLHRFGGQVVTIKCFEDNSKVAELVATQGDGRVLVVDGGGALRRSLLGDQLAAKAIDRGWAGIVVYGAIRDIEDISAMKLGVVALGTIPRKTEKRGEGQVNVTVTFAGVSISPDDYLYADATGIVTSEQNLMDNDVA